MNSIPKNLVADILGIPKKSLVKFENSGLFGVIVGKALYENKFTISEANYVLSSERLTDFDLNNNFFA